MKRVYSFNVDCSLKDEKDSVDVVFVKPTHSAMEDAEFYYGQQFNRFLKAGFLSRAMMNKEFGDLGGLISKQSQQNLVESITKMIDAQRTIEFYGGAQNLTEEQAEKLKESKETFTLLQKQIAENDINIRNMYSQSADSKAEESLIKWFVLNNSFYSEDVIKDGEKKSELFALFDGANLNEKKDQLDSFLDDLDETPNRKKRIALKAIPVLNRVVSLWYNGFGNDQDSIEKSLKEFFSEEEDEKKPVENNDAAEEVLEEKVDE